MPKLHSLFLLLVFSLSPSDSRLLPIHRANLCVTEGSIDELPGQNLSVTVPKMRVYVDFLTPQDVEAQFTYLGSTGNEALLGSGELRRQFVVKLRAGRLQSRLRHVAYRTAIEACTFREK
jgi:hypothetical protein